MGIVLPAYSENHGVICLPEVTKCLTVFREFAGHLMGQARVGVLAMKLAPGVASVSG